jgi:hypothetical protein
MATPRGGYGGSRGLDHRAEAEPLGQGERLADVVDQAAGHARFGEGRDPGGRPAGGQGAARLAAALGGAGVHGAEVTVEPVAAVARHQDTGKARRFVTQPA